MATLLIDIRDVTTQPITGDTVTLTAPAPRPATGGGVTRPFNRLVTLVDGKATVEVDPGPLRVTFHDGYGREVVIDTRVPDDSDVFTLRELVVADLGDLDDVPGIREALDGKADVEHEHNIGDIVDLDDVLDGKATTSHDHVVADITDLSPVLSGKADVNHRHTINDVDDLTWSLDQKVNVTDLRESVKDFSAEYLARIVDGAPESLDTLREVAAEFERQDDAIEAVFTELSKRAMKSHQHRISDVAALQEALQNRPEVETFSLRPPAASGWSTATDGVSGYFGRGLFVVEAENCEALRIFDWDKRIYVERSGGQVLNAIKVVDTNAVVRLLNPTAETEVTIVRWSI